MDKLGEGQMPFSEEVSVLVPNEREEEYFKGDEDGKKYPIPPGNMDGLVDDKKREHSERRGIGPQLVFDEGPDQKYFYEAMRKEVERAEKLQFGRYVRYRAVYMEGDVIVRVLEELRGSHDADGRSELARKKEQYAKTYLDQSGKGFEAEAHNENQADLLFRYVRQMRVLHRSTL